MKVSDTGEIYTQKSESSDCICCEGNHIFSMGIHWDNRKDFYSLFQEMVSKIDKHKAHGKKVKISIELI